MIMITLNKPQPKPQPKPRQRTMSKKELCTLFDCSYPTLRKLLSKVEGLSKPEVGSRYSAEQIKQIFNYYKM